MAISCDANCMDQGVYTIAFDLTDANGATITRKTLTIDFVSSANASGALIDASAAGTWFLGDTPTIANQSADRYMKATLTNRSGGRVFGASGAVPPISAVLSDSSTTKVYQTMTTSDAGGTTNEVGNAATRAAGDGVYGIYNASAFTAQKGPGTLTVRYGLASDTASVTMLTTGSATVSTAVGVTATGISPLNTSTPWSLPLTTTSAVLYVTGATPGSPYSLSVAYTGVAAGDQSPLDSTPTTAYADADGKVTWTITNSTPVDGAEAVLTVTGFTTTNPDAQTIVWKKSKAVTVSVSMNGAYVKTGSSNTFTATVTDAFGAPVAGVKLSPSVAGANEDETARATVTTDANGQASITLTDAAAVAADTDEVTFAEVGTAVSGSATITYAATAPAASAMTLYYSTANANTTNASITTPVPTSTIYYTGVTMFSLGNSRKTTAIVSATDGNEFKVKAYAGVAGVPITATTSAGAYVLSSVNLQATSRTIYADSTGYAIFTVGTHASGVNTITFTSGTKSSTVNFYGATSTNQRFITLSGPTSGTANGATLNYTVSVTDRFGNPVPNVNLSISATGVAQLQGGATLTSFTTDSTGSFTFGGTSNVAAGGTGGFKVSTSAGTDNSSPAGYVGTTAVESTLAAGNSSASVSVTFAAGTDASVAAAEAATDAAAEAIDAANAATDAANLAAEAADAATVAAEEARDAADAATAAVEELATQVATLMAALKAQITTLANTVAKIAKKVKA
jgi:hypothetical protein